MSALTTVARGLGWASIGIGGLQAVGGSRVEAGGSGLREAKDVVERG